MRKNKILTFYNPKMALKEQIESNYSMSPNKPKLFMEYLKLNGFEENIEVFTDFEPFEKNDFLIGHSEKYVDAFFKGKKPLCENNGLKWTKQFVETVTYTNASLYNAIKSSIENPYQICFTPTSGFHHANPNSGSAFCTFSGQVISSVKIYRDTGLKGAYLDLDGHYGNSIEDSRNFVSDLNEAIPIGCNINPIYQHKSYLKDLEHRLEILQKQIINNNIHYLVHCKGADSHILDDMRGQLTTKEWLKASEMVYCFVKETSRIINKPLPLTISLFGGYRRKAYNKVLDLHLKDLELCHNILCR